MALRDFQEDTGSKKYYYSNSTLFEQMTGCFKDYEPKKLEIKKLNALKEQGIKFNEIGLLLERRSERCPWGMPLSSNNIDLSLLTLSLMMPEFDWAYLIEYSERSIWFDSVERFHEDFFAVIPNQGGTIPISEIASWVNSLRILILNGQETLDSKTYL
jgi:hypothetical protein